MWENQIIGPDDIAVMKEKTERLGKQDWELVSLVELGGWFYAALKRQRQVAPARVFVTEEPPTRSKKPRKTDG